MWILHESLLSQKNKNKKQTTIWFPSRSVVRRWGGRNLSLKSQPSSFQRTTAASVGPSAQSHHSMQFWAIITPTWIYCTSSYARDQNNDLLLFLALFSALNDWRIPIYREHHLRERTLWRSAGRDGIETARLGNGNGKFKRPWTADAG